jgi:hypothetical protein
MTTLRQIINDREENMNPKYRPLTIQDEARNQGYAYGYEKHEIIKELWMQGASLEGILKQAYQEGFLKGFAHKFDNTNYEE